MRKLARDIYVGYAVAPCVAGYDTVGVIEFSTHNQDLGHHSIVEGCGINFQGLVPVLSAFKYRGILD